MNPYSLRFGSFCMIFGSLFTLIGFILAIKGMAHYASPLYISAAMLGSFCSSIFIFIGLWTINQHYKQ